MSKLSCKLGWIVLIRSDFTPYPSAALLSPLRVLNPLSSLSSSPGFLVVGFSSYLQGVASSFGNGVATSDLRAIRGTLCLVDFSLFLLVPSGVFRRDGILYARSDAESASLRCSEPRLSRSSV